MMQLLTSKAKHASAGHCTYFDVTMLSLIVLHEQDEHVLCLHSSDSEEMKEGQLPDDAG